MDISALTADEEELTGAPRVPGRRYIPALVVTEGFPVNPMTAVVIRQELRARGLLQGRLVGPLLIVDQEELDMVESLTETGEASMLGLLDGWSDSPLRNMPVARAPAASRRWRRHGPR